jgi:hypothetical protein
MTRDEAEALLTDAGERPDKAFPLFEAALAGALQALSRAQVLDGGATIEARAARERMRLRLN